MNTVQSKTEVTGTWSFWGTGLQDALHELVKTNRLKDWINNPEVTRIDLPLPTDGDAIMDLVEGGSRAFRQATIRVFQAIPVGEHVAVSEFRQLRGVWRALQLVFIAVEQRGVVDGDGERLTYLGLRQTLVLNTQAWKLYKKMAGTYRRRNPTYYVKQRERQGTDAYKNARKERRVVTNLLKNRRDWEAKLKAATDFMTRRKAQLRLEEINARLLEEGRRDRRASEHVMGPSIAAMEAYEDQRQAWLDDARNDAAAEE